MPKVTTLSFFQESDIQMALQMTQKEEKWLEEKRIKVQSTPKYENPPITVAQLRQEIKVREEYNLRLLHFHLFIRSIPILVTFRRLLTISLRILPGHFSLFFFCKIEPLVR